MHMKLQSIIDCKCERVCSEMKKCILGLVVLVVAVMLLAGCTSQDSGDDSQVVVPGSAPTQNIIASSEPAAESVIASSEEATSSESTVSVLEAKAITFGDTIVAKKWEISIQSVNFGYTDDEGNIWLDVYLTVKNLQKEAEDPFSWIDPSVKIELDYNDGYKYSGSTGFESTYLSPLETKSNIEYSIQCPQEVETNTDAPLFLTITVQGTKYNLTIR